MRTTLSCSIVLVFSLLCNFTAGAQNFRTNFKGTVLDDTGLPLPGATVMLLFPQDSTLAQFASTDNQGAFLLKSVPKGEFLLHISFLGMHPYYKAIISGNATDADLGTLKMEAASTILSEVEVKADYIPMEIKKDTISYNADAFQTAPDAVVEDLLKKLPGIEVQQDGSIKAQGENVNKVLVDGKEFFGDDPKMATKNLPAKAVKKVKVYDKKSDIAEFTGVDDGLREKTIDLQLKEEFKQGLFGKAQAGYGSGEKYIAKASFNRFSKTLQLSFLGQYNNINEQGFSFNDQMSFGGNQFSGGGGDFRFSSDVPFSDGTGGLINTSAGGLNFNWQPDKKINLRSSYFYNNVDNTLLQHSLRENLAGFEFDTEEDLERSNRNEQHRVSFNGELKPDTLRELNMNARLNFGNGNTRSERFSQNFIPGASVESESFTHSEKFNDNFSGNGNLSFVRRFGSKGKNIATTLSANRNASESQTTLEALTEYFRTGNEEALDQLQFADSDNTTWSIQSSYTQPLLKRRFLEFNYMYSHARSEFDKQVDDILEGQVIPNPALSNNYESIFRISRPGMTFRYAGEKDNVNVALQYQFSDLSGEGKINTGEITKTYKHFLPRVIWRNDIGNGKNFRISYTTRVNAPSVTQLTPVVDNSDPLKLILGNPDLNAEFQHNAYANFHSFTQFSSTSFFISLSGSLVTDKIITSKSIDPQTTIETITPVNIDRELTGGIYASFGKPVKAIHSRINTNANVNYTRSEVSIDGDLIDATYFTRSGGISFTNLNSKVIEFNIGGQWTLTSSDYGFSDELANSTVLHNYFAEINITFLEKWKIGGNYNYSLYTSRSFPDQSLPLLRASLSRYILPKDKGQIVFSVFDALDENRGISRSAQVNYIEEIRSNSIGRYFMLSFVYNIRGAGQDPAREMRIMGHRH